MKVAVDFDNVIVDSHAANVRYIKETFGLDLIPKNVNTSSYAEVIGWPSNRENDLLKEISRVIPLSNRATVANAVEVAQYWHDEGIEIYIISGRPKSETIEVSSYCKSIEFPYSKLFCVNALHANPERKAKICDEYGVKALVDDQLKYLVHCTSSLPILFNHPTNQNATEPDSVVRANGWLEAERLIGVHTHS